MTIDYLLQILNPGYDGLSDREQKQRRHDVFVSLQKICKVSQPAVSRWNSNGIPADRAIEIVKHYKLDPSCLL